MGKIGVLVALKGPKDKAAAIGKQIAMHVAATAPASLSEADLPPALIEREKAVLTEQARESGKPEAVIEKMIVGRMAKFFEEVTLLGQKFVINPDITVAQAARDAGVEVTGFARVAVGEGIEKEKEDFAAEVAKTRGA
jgi:elongation factor Ts